MTGFFLDYYVTDRLIADPVALASFKTWFEKVAVDWMNINNLAPKSKIPRKTSVSIGEKLSARFSKEQQSYAWAIVPNPNETTLWRTYLQRVVSF